VDEYSEFIKELDIPITEKLSIPDFDDVAYKAMLEDVKREEEGKKELTQTVPVTQIR